MYSTHNSWQLVQSYSLAGIVTLPCGLSLWSKKGQWFGFFFLKAHLVISYCIIKVYEILSFVSKQKV